MNKKITVITATHNYGHFIEETVESVLNQSFQDFEYIIIDDGSSDDTPQRMEKYQGRVKYIYQENKGQFLSFNKFITIAQGEYIAFLDADDKWHQDFLKRSVYFLENNTSAAMVFCNFSLFKKNGIYKESAFKNIHCLQNLISQKEFILEQCLEQLIQQDFIFPSCAVVRKSVFDQLRFEPIFKGSDYDFFIRVAFHYKIGVITDVLTFKRDHQNNSSSVVFNSMTDRIGAMQRLLATPKLDLNLMKLAKKRVAEASYYLAYDEFKKKNFSYSIKYAGLSFQTLLSWRSFKTLIYSFILSIFFRKHINVK